MDENEPKTKSSIIVRPGYTGDGSLCITSSVRWIGMLFVNSKKIYESTDYDTEGAAFNAVAKHIQWYQNKYDSNIFIDANMGRLKNK